MNLNEYIEDAAYEIAFWMSGIFDKSYPLDQIGDRSMEVCTQLRTVAACILLSAGSTNGFCHNLIRSGRVREQYLKRCLADGQLQDHFRSSGWYRPLFDVIAAGEYDLARRIVVLSPDQIIEGHEYEDDFCYAQIVHGLVSENEVRIPRLLAQFESYLEGETNGRYLVAKALVNRDQAEFNEAFSRLLLDRRQEIDEEIERADLETEEVIAARRVFVEGLALLRLAGKVGLKTEEQYQFCPSLARVPMTAPFPGE